MEPARARARGGAAAAASERLSVTRATRSCAGAPAARLGVLLRRGELTLAAAWRRRRSSASQRR